MSTAPHTGMELAGEGRAEPTFAEEHPPGMDETRAVRLVEFAGVMMVLVGGFEVVMGLTAAFANGYFEATKDPLVTANYDVWGWLHVALGTLAVLAGVGLFRGRMWARVLGVVFAMSCAIVNIGFVAVAPIWSIAVTALCVVVIWAIVVHGRELDW